MSTSLRDAAAALLGRRSVDHVVYEALWAVVEDYRAGHPQSLQRNLDRLAESLPRARRSEGPAARAYRETLRAVEQELRAAWAPAAPAQREAGAAPDEPSPLSRQTHQTIARLVPAVLRRDALGLQHEADDLRAQSRAAGASPVEQGTARALAVVARAFADPWARGHRSSENLSRYLGPAEQPAARRAPAAHGTVHAVGEAVRTAAGAMGNVPAFGAVSDQAEQRR